MSGGGVCVVIPAYDEEATIGAVVRALPREVEGRAVEAIVVSDGSRDRTVAAARSAGAAVVELATNRGQGAALRAGFAAALERRAAVVVTMDADGQHDPTELAALVGPVLRDEQDYVQGSRFLGRYDDAGGSRDAGIKVFTAVINLLGRVRLTDCTNGYRAIAAPVVAAMRLEEDRFSAPEIIMEAARHGARMAEVPVHIRRREVGESKKPRRLRYPLGFLRVILQVRLRPLSGRR